MPVRILIVEDEVITALDIQRELVALGHEVVATADNTSDAIKAVETHRPDLVLMDIHLSGGSDGITAASAIRGEANVPVVFLTAHSDQATLQRALAASPFGYILKPFQMREVEISIEMALYKHAKETEMRALIEQLEAAAAQIKVLSGFLPICASCKKIRDEHGQWHAVESYVSARSNAEFSHGICPQCSERLYPELR